MKKTIVFGLALVAAIAGASAQTDNVTAQQLRKSRLEYFQQRDASKMYLQKKYPQAPATEAKGTKTPGLQMPSPNWFPGEWEEVKAIVVTCYYNYYPTAHVGDQYWYADPTVTGVADYYHYSNGWSQSGSGAYVGVPDTADNTFSNVFFYLMDGIQSGGAEAWVRVENASDTNIIKRKLTRMNLRHNNLRFIIGPGNSFWYRDCGPIAFYYGAEDSVAMTDFMYYPGRALDDSLPTLISEQMGIPNYITTIEWEGGNCLVDGTGMVFSSDAIYSNNEDSHGQLTWDGVNPSTINYTTKPALTEAQVRDSLSHILGSRATHILPAFKYDGGTGHVDLYADMWDENEFVFSKFPAGYSNWTDYKTAAKNIDSLCSYTSVFGNNYKKTYIPFPCTNNGGAFTSQSTYNSNFTRTYSNHTFVNNVIVQPVFSAVVNGEPSSTWDRERFDSLKSAYPGYTLYPIDVREFDGSGGAIHCITKQIPADNPVRILHPSVTGDASAHNGQNIPIEATVTNRSGISSVTCYYRVNGGSWSQIALTSTGNANNFAASMPTASLPTTGNYAKVEYYISATSNNGKTITKPMTANQGGYYTFYLGSEIPVGIRETVGETFGQFYPNPSTTKANIEINLGNGSNYDVQIVDLMGRTVHHTSLAANGTIIYTINTDKFAKGIYHVVFTTNDGKQITRKLVVQ